MEGQLTAEDQDTLFASNAAKFAGITDPVVIKDWASREVIVTEFAGHYGPAGVIITLNGSPVRATMVVYGSQNWGLKDIVFISGPKVKRLHMNVKGNAAMISASVALFNPSLRNRHQTVARRLLR